MKSMRYTCGLRYFHEPHSSIVVLINADGIADEPVVAICGGKEFVRHPSMNEPQWGEKNG